MSLFRECYPTYYAFISHNNVLRQTQIRVCALIRAGFRPGDKCLILNVNSSKINKIKIQINKKLFGKDDAKSLKNNLAAHFYQQARWQKQTSELFFIENSLFFPPWKSVNLELKIIFFRSLLRMPSRQARRDIFSYIVYNQTFTPTPFLKGIKTGYFSYKPHNQTFMPAFLKKG